jgi:hypothetical protein
MEGVDDATAFLILQLQIRDIDELISDARSNEEGASSREFVDTLTLQRADLSRELSVRQDRRAAISLAMTIQQDARAIAAAVRALLIDGHYFIHSTKALSMSITTLSSSQFQVFYTNL